MIKQLSETVFVFSFIEIPAMFKEGDDPYLDSIGAVSHLLPTIELIDKEELEWIRENNISYQTTSIDHIKCLMNIEFENKEDAMAFKLRWC